MKSLSKYLVILVVFSVMAFMLFDLKSSDKIEIIAQYEMLACEKCDHMLVIRSNKKELVGESIIPVAEKPMVESVVNFSTDIPNKLVCIKGRLFLLDYSFDLIDPKGKKFYVDSFGEESLCTDLVN